MGKIKTLINRKIDSRTWSDLELWKIGRGDVGEDDPRNLTGPQARMIWIHQGTGDDRKIGTAVVSTGSGLRYDKKSLKQCINLECWVGKPDTADPNSKTLYVKELSPKALAALDGITPDEQATNEATFTDPANLTNLRVEVIGAKEVNVTKGTYTRPSDGNLYKFDESRTGFNGHDSIATLIGALTSGQHQVAWICLARETGKVKVVASTAVSASGTLPQRSQLINTIFTISVTTTYKRIVPVYLYYGQSEVAEVDIYRQFDARIDSTAGASGGGGIGNVTGPGSSVDNVAVRWDGATGTLIQSSAWKLPDNATGFYGQFAHSNTADRTYTMPDRSTGFVITTPGASTDNVIQPSGDFKALIVKGNASQTVALQEWQNSGGTLQAAISAAGHASFGATALSADNVVFVDKSFTDVAATTRAAAFRITETLTAGNSQVISAIQTLTTINLGGFNATSASGVRGITNAAIISGSGTATGVLLHSGTISLASGSAVTNATGFDITIGNGSTGNLFKAVGYNVAAASNTGGGSISNFAGVIVASQTAATNNTYLLMGTTTVPSGNFAIYDSTVYASSFLGSSTKASAAGATWNGIEFRAATATITGSTNITTAAGFNYINIAQPTLSAASALTVTNSATVYIANAPTGGGAGPATITNPYALWVDAGAARFDGNLDLSNAAVNLILDSTTGTKIATATSQKLGFWNTTPIVQPTTGIAAATFVANTSGIANDTATFDGYTIGQVVKALRNVGLLA